MNWLDIVLLLLIVGVALFGAVRGFGRTALDALALYGALWLASTLAPVLAAHLSLHAGGAAVNRGWAFVLLFFVCSALGLGIAWYSYGMTQLSAGMFDKLLGIAAGIAAGMILAHGLVSAIVTSDPQRVASATLVSQGAVGAEMYSFPTYHAAVDTLTGAKTYRRELIDVGGK